MGQMERHLLNVSLLLWRILIGVETSPDCSGAFFSLSDCLDFVLEESMVYPQQGGACCIELGSVTKQSSTCLCEAAVEATRLGIQINVSRALALLSVCKIVAVPIAPCDIASPVPVAPWHASSPAWPETTPTPSPAPILAPYNAPTFPPDPSPAPSLPRTLNPAPPPFLPNFLSQNSGSSEVPTGKKRHATYFNLICTLFLIACL